MALKVRTALAISWVMSNIALERSLRSVMNDEEPEIISDLAANSKS